MILFFSLIALLSISAMAFLIKKDELLRIRLLIATLIPIFAISYYLYLGNYKGWFEWQQQQLQLQEYKNEDGFDIDAIIEQLENVLKIKPEDPEAWFHLGKIYLASGNHKEAQQKLKQAHKLEPNNEQYLFLYLEYLFSFTNETLTNEQITILNNILTESPNNQGALFFLTINAHKNENKKDVIKYGQKLMQYIDNESNMAKQIAELILGSSS